MPHKNTLSKTPTPARKIKKSSIHKLKHKKTNINEAKMSFTGHLDEFRRRVVRIALFILVVFGLNFLLYKILWNYIMLPMGKIIELASKKNITVEMVTSKLQDGFLIQLKICFLVAFLFSIPYIMFHIWKFIVPAVDHYLRKWLHLLFILGYFLFIGGILFANFLVWPKVLYLFVLEWYPPEIIVNSQLAIATKKYITIPEYLSFLFNFHLIFGLIFQIPIVSIILGFLNLVKAKLFFQSWKTSFILSLIIAAFLTPSDWFSMILLSIPMFLLYLISGVLVYIVQRSK